MSYFRYIDNGEGPTKLFIGGLHGNEGATSVKFLKRINEDDLSPGQFYFYNFDKTPYISTIKKEFYGSEIGLKILDFRYLVIFLKITMSKYIFNHIWKLILEL